MESTKKNEKIIEIIGAIVGAKTHAQSKFKDIATDSLMLMKVIVAVEQEFDVFLDDIDFIAIFNSTVDDFIKKVELISTVKE